MQSEPDDAKLCAPVEHKLVNVKYTEMAVHLINKSHRKKFVQCLRLIFE